MITFDNLKPGVELFDIYDYEVVTLRFVAYLDNMYAIFISVEHNKPISVYKERVSQLYTDKRLAYVDLNEILEAKLEVNKKILENFSH